MERIPQRNAFEMLLEARIHTADELKEFGFLHFIYEGNPLEACLSFLKVTLEKETSVLEAYKSLVNKKWELLSMRERMEDEAARCAVLWEGEAHHKKVDEFMNQKNNK